MLKELKVHHRDIIRMAFEGFKPNEIAAVKNITPESVRGVLKDPLAKAAMGKLQDKSDETVVDVRKRLVEMNAKALDVIERTMEDDTAPHNVSLKAALEVLDRTGHSAPKVSNNHMHMHVTASDLAEIKQRIMDYQTDDYSSKSCVDV